MRRFGIDKPELMAFTIGDSEKVYTIPLPASLPATTMEKMADIKSDNELFRFQLDLLRTYIGDAVETLTTGDVRDIMTAWYEESSRQGVEVGESSASSASSTSTEERSNTI